MKGKALRRALESKDVRALSNEKLPLIQDETVLIDPTVADEMLTRNKNNRPVNWRKVEEFAEIMRRGDWKLHPQGIILDATGNLLTGQTRLWAVIYADTTVAMRVSRGSPPETATVIDRGRPQSARDLATRATERKHSPTEASLARCMCVIDGISKPSTDEIAECIQKKNKVLQIALKMTVGSEKTKALLMVLGAVCYHFSGEKIAPVIERHLSKMVTAFEMKLLPYTASKCWGKGASFGMALRTASELVEHWRI